jgi:hypothetical protein
MLKNKTSIFAKIALVIALLTPMIAQADIMATLAMKAAQSYAERAVHDTEMQNKLIEMVKNDQGFKERLIVGIKKAIANPRFAQHREKAIAFLSNVENK